MAPANIWAPEFPAKTITEMEGSFSRFPAESVRLCAESLGIQASGEVSSAMAHDTSFRIRQVTDTAMQFMHHAKRRRLTPEDFDKAFKWSGIEPLYGHGASEPPSFVPSHHGALFSREDSEVTLSDVALGSPLDGCGLPQPMSVSATWLAVEGVGVSGGTESLEPASIEIQRPLNEAHDRYLSLLMEAVTGESEDLRRLALVDVQNNPSVANILPDLSQYLQETLTCWNHFTPEQLLRVLKLLLSLFRNSALFLGPYAPSLLQPLQAVITSPAHLQTSDSFDHWHVRQMAAAALSEIMKRSATPLNNFLTELHSMLGHLLGQREASLPVLYGVVLTLCHLGAQSIADVLFVHLEGVTNLVQSLLESADPVQKENALRVYETLLISAELLLTTSTHLQCPELLRRAIPLPLQPQTTDTTLFTSPGFGLETKKRTAITVVVEGMAAIGGGRERRDTPTLYDYLVDIFGERLSLRLSSHSDYKQAGVEVGTNRSGASEENVSAKHPPGDGHSLFDFLSQEGFKPAKIQLPLKTPPTRPRPPHRGMPLYTFPFPASYLPVQSNALELRPHSRHTHKTTTVIKGKSIRHRTSVAKAMAKIHPDIANSWL